MSNKDVFSNMIVGLSKHRLDAVTSRPRANSAYHHANLHNQVVIRASCILFVVACLVSLQQHSLTFALRNQWRSLETCSPHFDALPNKSEEKSCQAFCAKHYFNLSSASKSANAQVAEAYIRAQPEGSRVHRPAKCCCRYLAPWPAIVRPDFVRLSERVQTIPGHKHCLPLLLTSIRLTKRTTQSYSGMCKLLSKRVPLSLLELLKFVDYAAYLNYMSPKNPMIQSTLSLKQVKPIDREVATKIREAVERDLLDEERHLSQLDGYRLDGDRLRELDSVRRFSLGRDALRSSIVSNAFDEHVISYAVMDIAAAKQRIEEINRTHLRLPDYLLSGDYDHYDATAKQSYFRMTDISCKLLSDTKSKLTMYLGQLKATLSGLGEKLVYEHLAEKFPLLFDLLKSQQLYRDLYDSNCRMQLT